MGLQYVIGPSELRLCIIAHSPPFPGRGPGAKEEIYIKLWLISGPDTPLNEREVLVSCLLACFLSRISFISTLYSPIHRLPTSILTSSHPYSAKFVPSQGVVDSAFPYFYSSQSNQSSPL